MNPENKIIRDDVASILAEPINWEKLRGGAILLTGASGMLGSYILDTLITLNEDRDYGMTVYGLMRNPDKLPDRMRSRIHVIRQSVVDPIDTNVRFDYVLHTASPASPKIMRNDPVGTIAANALGAWNTLKVAAESCAKGFLFISSREIYGQPYEGQEFFRENTYWLVDPLDPRSCYPEKKKALIEKAKKAFGAELPKTVAYDDIEKTAKFIIDEIIMPQLAKKGE